MRARGEPFLSVVLPAFNEEAWLEPAVEAIAGRLRAIGTTHELIVVDDGSTDGTAGRARELARRLDARAEAGGDGSEMRVISYARNRGKGHAVREGVLASRGRFVLFLDVDLSTDASYIPAFLMEAAAGCDVVVASRRLPGARTDPPQGPLRRVGGKVFLALATALLGLPAGTTDVTCGFKMFRGATARALFARQRLDGWGFDAEILRLAHRAGVRVRELPVAWRNRADSRVRVLSAAFRSFAELLAIRRNEALGLYGPAELPVPVPGEAEAAGPHAAKDPGVGAAVAVASGRSDGARAVEEGAQAGAGVAAGDLRDALGRP